MHNADILSSARVMFDYPLSGYTKACHLYDLFSCATTAFMTLRNTVIKLAVPLTLLV